MPLFAFRALDPAGALVEGERESASREALVESLRKDGLQPLHTAPRRVGGGLRLVLSGGAAGGRAKDDTAAMFTRELATLLGAGLPLDQALGTIAGEGAEPAIREIALALVEKLRGGSSLADALATRPGTFPGYYSGLVRAGEAGGTLGRVLDDLAETMERARALRQEVRSALTYPILVLVAAGLSILILLLGVIPEFEPLFAGAGDALPFTAEAVMALSRGLRDWWWLLPAAPLALWLAVRSLRNDPAFRARLDARLLRLPAIGPLLHKIEAARFCRTLGTLIANGVDIVPALGMSARTLGNATLAEAVEKVAPRLRRGEGLHEPLGAAGVLPPLARRLVEIGEASGQLDRMLLTVARIYEEDIGRETKRLVTLLVPVVTLLLGILVAVIIGSILSAILTSYDLPF